ncbi:cell envelope integrity protein TolA [Paraherbaspirillum soli]|uniref:Cell envelope integrity protein TolA n=1 Tax=Paraherbaspirillum soli TaxID=631222 RepID=A0ABW0MDA8_9BURK
MTGNSPYLVPKEPGRWRAIALAMTVHAMLLAFLWVGVNWQSKQPIAVEAELWSPQIREAAPTPPPPIPVPEPKPEPIVKQAPPPPKVVTPPVINPEIALEQEKKRKEQERKERERQEQLEKQRLQHQAEEERKEKLKAEAEQKAAKDKLAAQEKAKQKAEADAKKKQQAAADAALENKRHDDELKRMLGQAVGTGAANSTGSAAQSQGPRGDPGYGQRLAAKIKSNSSFAVPEGLVGNPPVEYKVDLLPDGSISGISKTKASGVPGFDEAIKRAIERSAPFPKNKSGVVPPNFVVSNKPKEE